MVTGEAAEPRRRGRRRWLTYAFVVAVVLLPVSSIALAGYSNKLGFALAAVTPRHVDMPPDDAEPQAVVLTYLKALDAHDRRTATALNPRADVWIGAVRSIDSARVVRVGVDALGDGRNGPRPFVVAEFNIRTFNPDMFVWDNGRHSWGFYLQRKGGSGPWRIVDEGFG